MYLRVNLITRTAMFLVVRGAAQQKRRKYTCVFRPIVTSKTFGVIYGAIRDVSSRSYSMAGLVL